MKIDKNSKANLRKPIDVHQKQLKKNAERQYKQIDDESLRVFSESSYSGAIAALMLNACPNFINEEIQSDFYADMCEELCDDEKKDTPLYRAIIRRFAGQERYELLCKLDYIDGKTDALSKVINTKNQKTHEYRFDSDECAEILDYADKIQDKGKWFYDLLYLKNDDDSPMLSGSEICDLLKSSADIKMSLDDAKSIVALKDKNGQRIFSAQDCVNIICSDYYPATAAQLYRSFAENYDMTEQEIPSREIINTVKEKISIAKQEELAESIREEQAEESLKKYAFYREVSKAADSKDYYTAYGAAALLKNMKKYSNVFETVMAQADELSKANKSPRFNRVECCHIVQNLEVIRPALSKFVDYMNIKNADGSFAFNAQDCIKFCRTDKDTDLMQALLGIVDSQTGEQRFDTRDIVLSLRNHSMKEIKDWSLFERVALEKDEKNGEYRFDMSDCFALSSASNSINKHSDFFEYLLKQKDGDKARLGAYTLNYLLGSATRAEQNLEVFDRLLNMKNGEEFRFSLEEVKQLAELVGVIQEEPELFERFLTDKQDGKPRFSAFAICSLLKSHKKIHAKKDLFDRLYYFKVDNSYKFGAQTVLNLLDKEHLIVNYAPLFQELVNNPKLSEYNINRFMEAGYIRKIERYKTLFDNIFEEKHPFYARLGFDGKEKVFSIADKIQKEPILWRNAINRYAPQKCSILQKAVEDFLRKYYKFHPEEKPLK